MRNMVPISFLMLVTAVLVPAACKPKPPAVVLTRADGSELNTPPEPKAAEEDAARKLCDDANALASHGDAAAAEQKRSTVLQHYSATLAAAELWEARAQWAVHSGHIPDAIKEYEQLLFYRPNFPRVDAVREDYAAQLNEVGRYQDAVNMLQALYKNSKIPLEQLRLGQALVLAETNAGHGGAALEILVDLVNLPDLPESTRRSLSDKAINQIALSIGFSDAEALWKKNRERPEWAFVQPLLAYKLAKIYYHTRDYDRSEGMLNLVIATYGDTSYGTQAREFLGHLKARFELDPHTVGVILPLSGKFEEFGRRALQAIQMAFPAQGPIKLAVKDTQGEPNIAAQAVETLVLENHVVAVIGPLFSPEALAAALKCEELSVPLLSLSFREGLPQIGPFIFRTALTISAQAKALAKVAFEELGFTRFALLYPKNRYGTDFTGVFWDEVDRRHGEIRGAETYEPDQTTFREQVRRLVGRHYMLARSDFRDAVSELRSRKLSPMRLRSELDHLDKTLPPIVDFDAVIIPDSARQIGLIAPALAFEDIVLTHDPKTLDKVRRATKQEPHPVTLMGASTWNSVQTLDRCENYCEDAVFVDSYFANSTDPKVRDFIANFREVSGGSEANLQAAEAYDTAKLLGQVLSAAQPTSRKALRDALAHAGPFVGITGKLGFDGGGEAQKDLFVLTIRDHAIRLYEKPPETPRG